MNAVAVHPRRFARQMISVAMRKYGEHPDHKPSSAKMALANALRLARAVVGDVKVRAIITQIMAEPQAGPVEGDE